MDFNRFFSGLAFKVIAIALIFMISPAGHIHSQNTAKKWKTVHKKAKEHMMYEEYHLAVPYVEELVEHESRNALYNFWMGKCLYISYTKNKALQYFKVVEEVNPDIDKEFHYYYGLTLHYNLEYDKAIAEYKKDLGRYEPDSPEFTNINNRISQCLYAKRFVETNDSKLVKIRNMGESINTPYAEHSPVISADNSTLVITARRPESLGAQPEANYYDEDIYISHKTDEGWSEATNIGDPVNSKGHDATISLTADGKKMYIYRHKKQGGLYVSEFQENGEGWTEPRNVGKPLESQYYEASICESADGNKMLFTSDRPGGYGGLDIYMVTKDEHGVWGEPQNLGSSINTSFNEDAPFFHPDNKTLYYSSDGPKGLGGYDIFVTEWDSVSEGWLEPLNMGPPVNTSDDEIYFVLSADGLHGYYSSGKEGGMGEKDIYEIKFPYFRYPKRYYVIELVGVVRDANTNGIVPSIVRLVDKETGEPLDSVVTDPEMGIYTFEVEPERAYSIQVIADGYSSVSEQLITPEILDDDIKLEKNLVVSRPEVVVKEDVIVEEVPEFQHIYFDFDKNSLRETAKEELDQIADLLKKNPDMQLEILAHTDWFGTYDYNVNLSMSRAKNAMAYLKSKGIKSSRINSGWFSENRPMTDNGNDTGRQYNRRCEFRFVDNNGNVVIASKQLKKGGEQPYVDHTAPKGEPGFDNPEGLMASNVSGVGAESSEDIQTGKVDVWANNDSDGGEGKVVVKAGGKVDVTGNNEEVAVADASTDAIAGFEMKNIYFDFDKSFLRLDSKDNLHNIAQFLMDHPEYSLNILGHTDAYGSNDYNQVLSERRSNSAYNYLVNTGINSSRITMNGFSEDKPIDSNDNDNGRQNNRRVEFQLIKDGKVVMTSGK